MLCFVKGRDQFRQRQNGSSNAGIDVAADKPRGEMMMRTPAEACVGLRPLCGRDERIAETAR